MSATGSTTGAMQEARRTALRFGLALAKSQPHDDLQRDEPQSDSPQHNARQRDAMPRASALF